MGSDGQLAAIGDVVLDASRRIVRADGGRRHRLTPIECDLLHLLMGQAGQVVSRADIMAEVWQTDYLGDTRTLDVYVCRLRKKIEVDAQNPSYLHTVRGQGYRFIHPDDLSMCPNHV